MDTVQGYTVMQETVLTHDEQCTGLHGSAMNTVQHYAAVQKTYDVNMVLNVHRNRKAY